LQLIVKRNNVSCSLLLITPPFTQLNTAYPATAYLKGYLNTQGVNSHQADLGIEVINKLFSKAGLDELFKRINVQNGKWTSNTLRMIRLQTNYINTIEPVIAFLQGRNNLMAYAIANGELLPEAGRFSQLDNLDWAFGSMGMVDKAKHFATLYLEDLSDLIIETIDPYFGFSRYAERLGRSASCFDELHNALQQPLTYIDELLINLLNDRIHTHQPKMVGLSVPFPGNLYSALRCAQYIKQYHPHIHITMGGGYVNTELRSIKELRLFNYIDTLTMDDGEAPLLHLIEYNEGRRTIDQLKRTFVKKDNTIAYMDGSPQEDIHQNKVGTPDYTGLDTSLYLSVIEVANPMFRLWSDGAWNKLTLAHGCYWAKCSFCDCSLDYIGRYEPNKPSQIADRMQELMDQTGNNGFHFVDEAAPPVLMRDLALELLRRNMNVIWWTNIRFEKKFTPDLCRLLKASGCMAVSGGLEVASDRILKLINKGVSIEQVSQVTKAFADAGIMVHAYLMYGFPTQTAQETIDSLEVVKQLFELGLIDSGFWHQFAMTAHSDVGLHPEKYKVKIMGGQNGSFANNDLIHADPTGAIHHKYGEGLRKAIFNYMHGVCFDYKAHEWFEFKVPKTSLAPNYINSLLKTQNELNDLHKQVIWLGQTPHTTLYKREKNKKLIEMMDITLFDKQQEQTISVKVKLGQWLIDMLSKCSIHQTEKQTLALVKKDFEDQNIGDFDAFIKSKSFAQLEAMNLLKL